MVKKGSVFVANRKRFGFTGLTAGGCIMARNLENGNEYRFKQVFTLDKLEDKLTGEVDPDTLTYLEEKENSVGQAYTLVAQMNTGDKFIGNDGKVYVFVKKNISRIVIKDVNGVEYNAKIPFVKERLN